MSNENKYKDLSKNTFLFMLSGIGTKLISILLVPLYTNVLKTADYGNVDIVNTTIQLLIPILTLNIQDAVLRFTLDPKQEEKRVIGTAIRVIVISSIGLGVILILVGTTDIFPLDNTYYYYLFASFILGTLNNSFSMYIKAKNRVRTLAISGILNIIVICTLNIWFLLGCDMGIEGYLLANTLGNLVSVVYMGIDGKIFREATIRMSPKLARQMFVYSAPLMSNSVAWWINNASDRYILTYFCGSSADGVYAVAYKIPTILSALQGFFYNAWSVSAIKEYDKEDSDGFIGNVYTLYSVISFLGCSILLICDIIIAKIIYLNDFYDAWKFVPFLLLGTVFNGLALFEGCLYTSEKRTKEVSVTTIIGALTNTIANLILIPLIGALGASVATMIGYFVIWVVRTIRIRRLVKMKVEWNNQINSVILIMIQTCLAVFETTYWYQLIPFVSLIFVQRKNIGKFVDKAKHVCSRRL